MPPKKGSKRGPRKQTAPTPRPNRRGRSGGAPNPNGSTTEPIHEETTEPINNTNGPVNDPVDDPVIEPVVGATVVPPFQMDPAQLQAFITALAAYEAARKETASHSGSLGGNPSGHAGPSQYHFRSCSLKDFLACKPMNFHGTEGVVGLTRWIEKVEAVFHHSNCSNDCRVNYATSTLMDHALRWWNDHSKSMGLDAAYAMEWESFKVMLVEEYCPRQEIQKLETELWNHKMQGSDVAAYTARFNDLASLCPGMVDPEYKKIERYINGLTSTVQCHVIASRPTTYDSAKRLAYLITERSACQVTISPQTKNPTGDLKRKFHEPSRGDDRRPKPNPAPTTGYAAITNPEPTTAYAAITNTPTDISAPSRAYAGKSPLCKKCNFHHFGNCMFCNNCNAKGHTSNYCKRAPALTPATTNANSNAGGTRVCYECNMPGHFKKDCPKLAKRGGPGRAFFIGTRDAEQEPGWLEP